MKFLCRLCVRRVIFATCLKNEEFWVCHLSCVPTTYRKARKVNRTSTTESISCTRLGPFSVQTFAATTTSEYLVQEKINNTCRDQGQRVTIVASRDTEQVSIVAGCHKEQEEGISCKPSKTKNVSSFVVLAELLRAWEEERVRMLTDMCEVLKCVSGSQVLIRGTRVQKLPSKVLNGHASA